MAHNQPKKQEILEFSFHALYCEEENWEESNCLEQEEDDYFSDNTAQNPIFVQEKDLSWEEEELPCLITKEEQNCLCDSIVNYPDLTEARSEAVEWILKIVGHYSFSALTAILAVNYYDRFIFAFKSQTTEKPWMTQLAAVACLSLAAKVEETQVPLLLDLQVEENKYLFEAKTIQRMEVLVLSTLQWKMNPVTPLTFLDYFTRRLGLKSHLCWEFLKRCEYLFLYLISDWKFMCYLPSVMATATMLHVVNSVEPCIGVNYQTQLLGILEINQEKMTECCKLIEERAPRGIHFYSSHKRKFGSIPGSPKGVMDVSFSSDSSNDLWAVSAAASVSSSPEPLFKKSRAQEDEQHQKHLRSTNHGTMTADVLGIPL